MPTIIAQQPPDRYLVAYPDGKARILDRVANKLFQLAPIDTIISRGYWEDYNGPQDELEQWLSATEDIEKPGKVANGRAAALKYDESEARDEHGRWVASGADIEAAKERWFTVGQDYPIKAVTDAMMRGEPLATGQAAHDAKALLYALHNAPRQPELYRGLQLDRVPRKGEIIYEPLGSWSSTQGNAEGYADAPAGRAIYGRATEGEPVVLVARDAQAIPLPEEEFISGGIWQVTSVDRGADYTYVNVNQARTYGGEVYGALKLEKVDFFTNGDGIVHPIRGSEGYDDSQAGGGKQTPKPAADRTTAKLTSGTPTETSQLGGGSTETYRAKIGGVPVLIKPENGLPRRKMRNDIPKAADLSREMATRFLNSQLPADHQLDIPVGIVRDLPGNNPETGNPWGKAFVQEWVKGDEGWSLYNMKDEELHNIAFFDNLIGNEDRHIGNGLTAPDGHFISIDHGLAFGTNPAVDPYNNDIVQAADRRGIMDLTAADSSALDGLASNRESINEGFRNAGLESAAIRAFWGRIDLMQEDGQIMWGQ